MTWCRGQTALRLYCQCGQYPKEIVWYSWLRHCAISLKVAGSIPDGAIGIFYWLNPSSRSQLPRGLRRGSAVDCLLGLWFRIPSGTWMSLYCECCVLSGRGLCVGLITRTEESYQVWCVWVWSWSLHNEPTLDHWGLLRHGKKND
jgi:hypothetical protein